MQYAMKVQQFILRPFRHLQRQGTILALAASLAASLNAATILAIQDFEVAPSGPVWNYTGTPAAFSSGFSSATATPANSPLGIGGSQAWNVTTVPGGNPLTFENLALPSGYDGFVATFRLAAMSLIGSPGGPDNFDFVLTEYSIDGGATWVPRVRVRGALTNDSSWAYDATGIASVSYLPGSEALFQPLTSGLQTTLGYSTVEILFPGSITQISLRITPRSSSSNDTWLIDNVSLLGNSSDVPEPSAWALVGVGIAFLASRKRLA